MPLQLDIYKCAGYFVHVQFCLTVTYWYLYSDMKVPANQVQ